MRKFCIAVFVCILLFASFTSAYAATSDLGADGFNANVAYIPYIDEIGSNIGTDATNSSAITENHDVNIKFDSDSLQITGSVLGKEFNVCGNILTANENGNSVIFEAHDKYNNYEVAFCALERDLDNTPLFFENYFDNNRDYKNVVKLYIRPCDEKSLIFVEAFSKNDIEKGFLTQYKVPYDGVAANINQAWFINYYDAVMDYSKIDTPQPTANTTHVTRDYSKSYMVLGEQVRYTFKVSFYCTLPDITTNGDGTADVFVYVDESNTKSLDNANSSLNSDEQHVLALEQCNIQYKSGPYIILTAQEPVRRMNGSKSAVDRSVSFGYSYGLFSVGGSYSFNQSDEISTDKVFFTQYTSKEGTMSTESGRMPNNTSLRKSGHPYGIAIDFLDMKGTARYVSVGVRMDFKITNQLKLSESKTDSYVNSYSIRVK